MRNGLYSLIHRHRLIGKRMISLAGRWLPASAFRPLRALAEQIAFRARPDYQEATLPPIFNYWSGRHLAPMAGELGITTPEAFYFEGIQRTAGALAEPVRILSLGAGACDLELGLARRLHEAGIPARLTCVDFNAYLMQSARAKSEQAGLGQLMDFVQSDCNNAEEFPRSHVILVNQFFHHVEALESFCRALRRSLVPGGCLLTSDVIGRNGHQLWPDVAAAVAEFWAELPGSQHFDRYFDKQMDTYRPVDHSAYSNEGIRAQDIVACLSEEFEFEVFFAFGGSIMPFVERRIGFNFDPENPADQAFIDRVHAQDRSAFQMGRYPASNMIASLRLKGEGSAHRYHPMSPAEHVRLTREQLAKVA